MHIISIFDKCFDHLGRFQVIEIVYCLLLRLANEQLLSQLLSQELLLRFVILLLLEVQELQLV